MCATTRLVGPRTAYSTPLVSITKAQTAQAFPLAGSARPLRLMRNNSLVASRRRTCSRRLSPGGMVRARPLRLRLGGWGEGEREGVLAGHRVHHPASRDVQSRPRESTTPPLPDGQVAGASSFLVGLAGSTCAGTGCLGTEHQPQTGQVVLHWALSELVRMRPKD